MLSDTVGERVTALRKRRGWNRERLAEACHVLGMPELTPAVLTNIESGRRQKGSRRRMITVDELAVIALALSVPLPLLLAPYPEQREVEMWPGKTISSETAFNWLTAEEYISFTPAGDALDENNDLVEGIQVWNDSARPIHMLRTHHRLAGKILDKRAQLVETQQRVAEAEATLQAGRMDEARLRVHGVDQEARQTAEALLNVMKTRLSSESAHLYLLLKQIRETERHLVSIRQQMVTDGYPPTLPVALDDLRDKTPADFTDDEIMEGE